MRCPEGHRLTGLTKLFDAQGKFFILPTTVIRMSLGCSSSSLQYIHLQKLIFIKQNTGKRKIARMTNIQNNYFRHVLWVQRQWGGGDLLRGLPSRSRMRRMQEEVMQ
jgi:hypothetical protein